MLAASVGRARVAGVGLHPQRAELDGLADILVEIDDAAGDLVEAGEARLLVDDLLRRRLGDDLVAGLQGGRRCGTPWAASGRAPARQRIGAGRGDRDALAGLRRRHRDARLSVLRNDGRARRRRQRLRLHRSGRRNVLPRQRAVRAPAATCLAAVPALPLRRRAPAAWLPRGILPGGRGDGSEKILPICARAGGASEIVVAARRAAKPV